MVSNPIFSSDSQSQKAGDNSNQFQIAHLTIGIDEKRAREIFDEKLNLAIKDFSDEATRTATNRINNFENLLIEKMTKVEDALTAFADPSFQVLLLEAQRTAAASEREFDFELLSQLMLDRFQRGQNKLIRTGINRAVEIIDEISDEALLGLTAYFVYSNIVVNSSSVETSLNILNNLFKKIVYDKLPEGQDWLDQLDILSVIRLIPFSKPTNIRDTIFESLNGLMAIGISKNSEDLIKAKEKLIENKIPLNILVDNKFLNDYVRLDVDSRNMIEEIYLTNGITYNIYNSSNPPIRIQLSKNQKNVLYEIYDSYKIDSTLTMEIKNKFNVIFESYSELLMISKWIDNLPFNFQLTSVGRVIAAANAKRCEPSLPNFDI